MPFSGLIYSVLVSVYLRGEQHNASGDLIFPSEYRATEDVAAFCWGHEGHESFRSVQLFTALYGSK